MDKVPLYPPPGPPVPVPLPPPLRLELTSDAEQIGPARKAIEAFARDARLDAPGAEGLGLAVNEALANVIRHAYQGQVGRPILLSADCDDSQVRVTIRDWGCGANPMSLMAAAGLRQRPRDPATPGGLGLVCLRTLTDHLEFTPQPDGMLLTMAKRKKQDASKTGQRNQTEKTAQTETTETTERSGNE